jgi:hypothetical protein
MMPISSRFRDSSLMSARTAKYVEAMIREGDDFDYDSWLKKVRDKEAQAKQLSTASRPAGQIGNLVSKIGQPRCIATLGPGLAKPHAGPKSIKPIHSQNERQGGESSTEAMAPA